VFGRGKRKIRKALGDRNLEVALRKAVAQHAHKFQDLKKAVPWEEYKDKARAIKEECIPILPELIAQFSEEARKTGAQVYQAATSGDARSIIDKILAEKKARLVVKSKSMVSEEIGLNDFLEERGFKVVETDLGEWIVQLAGERPSHITAPALHKTKEEVAALLSKNLGRAVPADIGEMVKTAREELRRCFIEADAGISGANLAVAETGTLVILSNEGNARLVTGLPPVHIALVTAEKFVRSLEQAALLMKALTGASSGTKLTSYVSFITGPSRTTDIEKELVIGVHGPREVHIIILDNGRLAAARSEEFKETMYCLKCGGCMLVCPVFQAVGGYRFGGPVYPGGIGLLLTAMTRSPEEALPLLSLCADCKKCEEFCPVKIPSGELLLGLKALEGPSPGEKALSLLFQKRGVQKSGARILLALQKLWQKDGFLKKLPVPWAKGKLIPVLKAWKSSTAGRSEGEKVYLFEGCLARFFFPEIRESVIGTLARHGFNAVVPPEQACCGAPSLHLGDRKGLKKLAESNLKSFESADPAYILTVCPTGNSILKKTYPRLLPRAEKWVDRIFDFTEFLVRKGLLPEPPQPEAGTKKDIYYHYPCHYLAELKLREEPKTLLRSLGYNPKDEGEPYACCGFCGVFSFKNPEISARFWEKKKRIILESGVREVATDCPGCVFQLRASLKKEGDFKVYHTAELYARAGAGISGSKAGEGSSASRS
jgi:iron-sulfur cluster protein